MHKNKDLKIIRRGYRIKNPNESWCCHYIGFIKPLTSRNVWRNIGCNGTSQHQRRAARSALLQMFVYGTCTRTPHAPWDNGPQRTTSTEDLLNSRYERIRSSSPLGTKNVQLIPSISAKECTVLGTKKSQHICQRRDFLVPGGRRTMYSLADMLGIGWALLVLSLWRTQSDVFFGNCWGAYGHDTFCL